MLFIQHRKKSRLPFTPGFNAVQPLSLSLSQSLPVPDSPGIDAASYHSPTDSTADPEAVLAEASSRLYSRFGFSSCTLQVEQYQPEMAQCLRCQEPPQA